MVCPEPDQIVARTRPSFIRLLFMSICEATARSLRNKISAPEPTCQSVHPQISADDFYTSLNPNGKYVARRHIVCRRSTHTWFWRPKVDDETAVFHRKETTKPTLKNLAYRRTSGLTPTEANNLLDRQCYRPLRKLSENDEIHAADQNNTTVYVEVVGPDGTTNFLSVKPISRPLSRLKTETLTVSLP